MLLDGDGVADGMGCVARAGSGFATLGGATGFAPAPGVARGTAGTGACGIEARPTPLSSPLSIFAAVDFVGAIGFATRTAGMCAGRGGCFG
jgi:hypothetical protein